MEVDADVRAYDALSKHPRIADLAAIASTFLAAAGDARRYEGAGGDSDEVMRLASERALTHDEAATPLGNALDVLGKGPGTTEGQALARALAAHALSSDAPSDSASARLAAGRWLWLAAHTPFDALPLIEAALTDPTPPEIASLAQAVRGGLAQILGPLPPRRLRVPEPLRGQVRAPPRGPAATAVLGLTGLLFVTQAARLFGRWALGYKTPAEIAVADDGGVRVRWRVELLGRILRDREVFVPRSGLARASREVRFSGAALYVALLSLALGSYVGVSAFVDGARAASPALLASGLVIVALGLGLDFVFSCLLPGARGHCRMVVVPRRGPALCVGDIDKARADALLGALAQG